MLDIMISQCLYMGQLFHRTHIIFFKQVAETLLFDEVIVNRPGVANRHTADQFTAFELDYREQSGLYGQSCDLDTVRAIMAPALWTRAVEVDKGRAIDLHGAAYFFAYV